MVKQLPSPSELQLQGQLDRARAADLIERIEAAVGSAGAEAAGKRLRRLAEEWVSQGVVWRAEVRVVEEVEELAAETQPYLLRKVKLPMERDVSRSIIESHHGRLWTIPNDGPGANFSF